MRIATWNVNSLRVRLPHLHSFVRDVNPDVVCLQETKVEDARYPEEQIADLGYRSVIFGQKTYNGVATLLRFGLEAHDIKKNLDGDEAAEAAKRLLAVTVDGIRIINVYVPNGQAVGTAAFAQKLAFLERLKAELVNHHAPSERLFLCGDFNVAPEPIDVHDPSRWEGHVLFHPDERARLRDLLAFGLVDCVRSKHPDEPMFSWWDYRMGGYRRNHGLRIDLALATKPLATRCIQAEIDRRPRELERPSDHAPVVVEFDV